MTISEKINFGIINIDKPKGPTSFTITDFVRKSLGISKATHLGTLDPAVTGVLPIALGRAARLSAYLMHAKKEYIGKMHIHQDIAIEKIKEEIKKSFLGKIRQLPPVRSRVKRAEREREIYEFEILEKKDKDISFRVKCQAGTYIRKLVFDLGEKLKIGAHMTELRRTSAGLFQEKDSIKIQDFEKAVEKFKKGNSQALNNIIIPAEEIIKKILPVIQVKKETAGKLLTGKPIFREDIEEGKIPEEGKFFAVFCDSRFIEIAKVVNEEDLIAKPEFVLN
ncbi:RNA-guided pseudouridylation complex pseudouridine synthase subunit Cbf5 [Candidatus Pacearchaeota archaeon CG06_land_8_20_14_3_00_35_12]|nr:MAG: RNA-guided pseudouridylation complex pseudouridine synthase subunit Cbf5 [Candidatus Pacearchaeota archaeon CG06_land_8_20_14_3_00_35_12]